MELIPMRNLDGGCRVAFAHLLQDCTNSRALSRAYQVHAHAIEGGVTLHEDVVIGNHLIEVYNKCGSIDDARWVFARMPSKDVVSWNTVIAASAQHCQSNDEALHLFEQMNKQGIKPTIVTFINILKGCSSLVEGECVHTLIKDTGFQSDLVISNALVGMFGRCGSLELAVKTFADMRERDVITWTTMITTYMQHGQAVQALECYKHMLMAGVIPTIMTFATIVNACGNPTLIDEGQLIHTHLVTIGVDCQEILGCALVVMYGKCQMMDDAQWLFDDTCKLEVVTWNSMISMHIRNGSIKKAIQVFSQMHHHYIKPNTVTFVSIFDACTKVLAFQDGRMVHSYIIEVGIYSDSVWNALLNMYGFHGSPFDAFTVFNRMQKKNVVAWTSLIQVFVQGGRIDSAFQAFQRMQNEGVEPNRVTFLNIVKACSDSSGITQGMLIHTLVIEKHLELDLALGNSLITMYGNCRSPADSCKIFASIPECDAVSWTAVIAAHAQSGRGKEAFNFFLEMLKAGVNPTLITYISIIDALASLTAAEEGEMVHYLIVYNELDFNLVVGNAIINFYAKCGKLDEALYLFKKLPDKDIVSWSAMITAYGHRGEGREAFDLLLGLKGTGLRPDDVTFISLLSACSHGGLITEGFQYMFVMASVYEIVPSKEHHRCIVDLLSRAGWLEEVETLILHSPFAPTIVEWMTLLGACHVHSDMERAKHAAEHVLEFNSQNPVGYVVLSNIYVAAGMHVEADKVRKLIKDKNMNVTLAEGYFEDEDLVYELVGA